MKPVSPVGLMQLNRGSAAAVPVPPSPLTAKALALLLINRGAVTALGVIFEVVSFAVPLIYLARLDKNHAVAGQLIDMGQLITLPFLDYCARFNTDLVKKPDDVRLAGVGIHEYNLKIFENVAAINLFGFIATVALMMLSAWAVFPRLGEHPEAVNLAQQFLTMLILGKLANLYARSLFQFVASTSDCKEYSKFSYLGIKWQYFPLIAASLSAAVSLAYTFTQGKSADPVQIALAFGLSQIFCFASYLVFIGKSKALQGFKFNFKEKLNSKGALLVAITMLQIAHPVLQGYLIGPVRSSDELAIFGIYSFIFNIGYVLGLGFSFGTAAVISKHQNELKKGVSTSVALQLAIVFLYAIPFLATPDKAISFFADDPVLAAKIKTLLLPLALWSISAAVGLGLSSGLRAMKVETKPEELTAPSEKWMVLSRISTQWLLNTALTAGFLFGSDLGVQALLWSNVGTWTLYAAMLGFRLMKNSQEQQDAASASSLVLSMTIV